MDYKYGSESQLKRVKIINCINIINATPSKIPGIIPATNNAPIDTPPAASEYITMLWLGGINIPCTELVMVTTVAKSASYPSFFITGISIDPIDDKCHWDFCSS